MNDFIKMFLIIVGLIATILVYSIANAGLEIRGTADPVKGKKVFRTCVACHSLQEGKNKMGPPLNNLLGRKAGSVEGYKYSKAMKNSGVVWNEESLDKFLTKPRKFIPKTKMSFRGIKKKSLRDDLISFLKSNG
jgi:cytochrome c